MKQFTSLLRVGLVALIYAIASIGRAEIPKPPSSQHMVIASISANSVTVDTGRNTKIFKVDKYTLFFYRGNRVTLNDVNSGMRVIVTPAFDNKIAASINASDAPKAPPATPAPTK